MLMRRGPSRSRIPTASAASSPTAGFADIALEAVEHELLVGGASDLEGAAAFAADSGSVRSVLGTADDDTRRRAAESIRAALAPYAVRDGVRLASTVWVVSAHKAGG